MSRQRRSVKKFMIRMLKRFPRTKALLNRIRLSIWKLKLKARAKQELRYFDPYRRYYIKPSKIEYCVLRNYGKGYGRGKIISGNWDQKRVRFESLDVFQAFQDRFIKGKDWGETQFYHRVLNQISSGMVKWGCENREDLDERCIHLDALFEDIRKSGYKSQVEIPDRKNTPSQLYDEVTVCIDRDGRFLFENGRHRLAIAKLLNLDKIPAQITLRHRKWHEFRCEVIAYAERNGGKIYSPIAHPDLSDIPAVHSHRRFEIIKRNLRPAKRGDLLDIGARWGYFCHKFEDGGFNCYAVEKSEGHLYFLEKIKKAADKKFKVIRKSIFEYREKTNFDVVLALNIFHHFLKEEETYYQLIEFLKRLDMKVMFFESHLFNEPQMKRTYANYHPDEFVDFILFNSCLKNAKHIGKDDNKRAIYMLYK